MSDKRLLNSEQIEAARNAARAKNPNAKLIGRLWKMRLEMADILAGLSSPEEQYYNLLFAVTDTDEKAAMAKCMSTNELGDHIINLCPTHNEMDQAILDEVLNRLGYIYEDPPEKPIDAAPSP